MNLTSVAQKPNHCIYRTETDPTALLQHLNAILGYAGGPRVI
jgi:hypothetical protein